MKTLLAVIIFITLCWGCNSTIKTTATAKEKFKTHRTIAILPIEIIDIQTPRFAENYSVVELIELKKYLSVVLQKRFCSLIKNKEKRFPYTVLLQDANKTNAILQNGQYGYSDIFNSNKYELAKLLSVDALISTKIIIGLPRGESLKEAISLNNYIQIRLIITDQTQIQPLLSFNQNKEIDYKSGLFKVGYATTQNEKILFNMSPTIDQFFNNFFANFPYKKK